jgi:CBS domain-containing protein
VNKTAADVMTTDIATIDPEWPLDRLLDFLSDKAISGGPVVAANGEPIGVVSLTDVARNAAVAERTDDRPVDAYYRKTLETRLAREEIGRFHADSNAQTTVRDIMTPVVFAVEEDATVQEVAAMMTTGRIHRVFVKRDGRMTGIITSMDLLPLVRDM